MGPDSYLTEEEFVRKQNATDPSATEVILKAASGAPGKTFTERLDRVLQIWPELGREWFRQR